MSTDYKAKAERHAAAGKEPQLFRTDTFDCEAHRIAAAVYERLAELEAIAGGSEGVRGMYGAVMRDELRRIIAAGEGAARGEAPVAAGESERALDAAPSPAPSPKAAHDDDPLYVPGKPRIEPGPGVADYERLLRAVAAPDAEALRLAEWCDRSSAAETLDGHWAAADNFDAIASRLRGKGASK